MNATFTGRTLDRLAPGESAVVHAIGGDRPFRLRLLELGLVPGTVVVCVGRSPLGDPLRFRVRDAVIGLRRADAVHVQLRSDA